jgi:uncharacterized protein with WD repeat
MKIPLAILVILFSSIVFCDSEWIYLNRDERVNRFFVNTKGKLHYDQQEVNNFSLQKTSNRMAISPLSPDSKYAVVFSFGDEDSQCAFLQLDKRTANTIHLDGTPMVWNSWSPSGGYFLLVTYTDKETSLYSTSISTLQPKKIPIRLNKEGEKTELNTDSVTWSSPETFELDATIHCASCSGKEEEKVLRSYRLKVNAQTLDVQSEEQAVTEEE